MALTDSAKALKPREKVFTVADNRGRTEVFPGRRGLALLLPAERQAGEADPGPYPAPDAEERPLRARRGRPGSGNGTSPAEQKRFAKVAAADATTVAEFGERFFREIVAKDRADLTMPPLLRLTGILPAIGARPVRDVTTEDAGDHLAQEGRRSDAAAGQMRGRAETMFDYAATAGLVTTNPVLAPPMRHVHKAKA